MLNQYFVSMYQRFLSNMNRGFIFFPEYSFHALAELIVLNRTGLIYVFITYLKRCRRTVIFQYIFSDFFLCVFYPAFIRQSILPLVGRKSLKTHL